MVLLLQESPIDAGANPKSFQGFPSRLDATRSKQSLIQVLNDWRSQTFDSDGTIQTTELKTRSAPISSKPVPTTHTHTHTHAERWTLSSGRGPQHSSL